MPYPAQFVEWFGPAMWKTMHSIAFTAPENPSFEEQKDYVDFFRSLGPVIPCPSCSQHYQKYINETPIDASSRESIAKWVYDLHDDVNKRNGKQSPSFEVVTKDYTGWSQDKHASMNKLPKVTKLRKLADPHNGRTPESKSTGRAKEDPLAPQGSNSILIITALALLVFVVIRRRRQTEKE
mgnify:CR=1 FL=1